MKTLADVLPPPPHKVIEPPHVLIKNLVDDMKGTLDGVKNDVKSAGDDVRRTLEGAAPHNMVQSMPKPDIKEMLPPAPPKPPRFSDR